MRERALQASPTGSLVWTILGQTFAIHYTPLASSWPRRLGELLAPFSASQHDQHAPTLTVSQAAAEPWWRVTLAGGGDRIIQDEDALLRHLEWQLFSLAVQHIDAVAVIHASAVTRNNSALVMPATSGSGKSTLALALLAQGWDLLTDDVCPITEHASLLAAQPCPRCCHLDAASQAVLRQHEIPLAGPIAAVDDYLRPPFATVATPVKWIVSPLYQAGAAVALEPLSQAESAALLVQSIFAHASVTRQENWQVAIRLAIQARGYHLTYSALGDAFAAIAQMVR